MLYKGYEIEDEKIDKYVENLEISIAEACTLILEEEGKIKESAETTKEIEEKTKNAPKRYERREGSPTAKKKERKVDENKGYLLEIMADALGHANAHITERKTETEIKFIFKEDNYTLKLTKHRPPKK